jgi:hypothetical protein
MKNSIIIVFIAFVTLLSCNTSADKSFKTTNTETALLKVDAKSFLNLFQEITFDNLHLYSPSDTVDGKKFVGNKIDSTFYKFFSYDAFLLSNLNNGAEIFACYKFKFSDTETGLIIRTRSQYSETAIKLCVWQNQDILITNGIELADAFGDGEWYFQKDGWLTDLNSDKQFDIVNRKMDFWIDDVDSGVGQFHTTDSVMTFLANGTKFDKSKIAIDTSRFKMFKMGQNSNY